jgi:N-acetylmuramoyl-L-alanine amidase CwlA
MKIQTIKAKAISYGGKRSLDSILYIVIHYTANKGDTAENNGRYFANVNKIKAGAHFFVDQRGNVVKSVNMSRVAWAVGGSRYPNYIQTGGAKYYGICTNYNSVSIELCDNATKDPSQAQTEAVRELIKYIKGKCKNANTVIRHFDVTGKCCPARMTKSTKWKTFKGAVT